MDFFYVLLMGKMKILNSTCLIHFYLLICIAKVDTTMVSAFSFKMTQKCDKTTLSYDISDIKFDVRSVLECSSLCSSNGGTDCLGFFISLADGYFTCVLRSDCSTHNCSLSSSAVTTISVYQRTVCREHTLSTISTDVSSLHMTSEISTEQYQTAPDCGTAGILVNNQCQCEPGCSGPTCRNCPQDCSEDSETEPGFKSIYIKIHGIDNPVRVLCNHGVGIDGVTYIQFRRNGDVSFNRSWEEYENGFGDIDGDFWLGNKYIRALLQQKEYDVGFRRQDSFGLSVTMYEDIVVDNSASLYRLQYGPHMSGEDGLSPPDTSLEAYGQVFSTYDRDPTGCAKLHGAGWWYNTGCSLSNLNGPIPVTFGSENGVTQTGIGLLP